MTTDHSWDVTFDEARDIQRRLAGLVVVRSLAADGPGAPRIAAGVDVGYSKDGRLAWACGVAMDAAFRVVDTTTVAGEPDMPYEPGLLAFREGRLAIEAVSSLGLVPDLVFYDGHGVVHERGLGAASHLGVALGLPVVGVAKTPFHAVAREPSPERGSRLVLTKEWGAQGAAIRLRSHVNPVYVSPGHLVDLDSSLELCLRWSTGRHRVPEPLQAADTATKLARNEES